MDNHFLAIFKTEFSTRKQQGKTFHWILFFYLWLISTRTAQATNKQAIYYPKSTLT